jgi:hypothetical protein
MKGTIKWYNGLKGYGFIGGEDGKTKLNTKSKNQKKVQEQ